VLGRREGEVIMSRVVAIILLLGFSAGVWAQSGSSTISGTVKDATSAVVPDAKIKIVNLDSGVQQDTVTNEAGLYRISALVPGRYRVEVDASGFDRIVRGPITLQVGQTVAIDLTVEVGKQSESVLVTEAAPLTESQSSSVAQTVNRQMLAGLPLPNRAASSLASLSPGVIMVDTGTGTAENYPVFTVAGGRVRNQTFVSNAVGLTRPQQLTTLPVDAMQEFQVVANNYSAEHGHSTGGIVLMSTRAGTSEYHGSLFESLQNDVLNARNFFAPTRQPIRLNQFGASFGGPIRKDKTFFFATWEQTRQLISDTTVSTVPTLLNRTADFSDLRSSSGAPVLIYDPATTSGTSRQAFPDNRIPSERLDPVAV